VAAERCRRCMRICKGAGEDAARRHAVPVRLPASLMLLRAGGRRARMLVVWGANWSEFRHMGRCKVSAASVVHLKMGRQDGTGRRPACHLRALSPSARARSRQGGERG
jgi:hypothetical protein